MTAGKLSSLMVREFTIIAKRHADLARDYRALAATWRQALDDTPADLLPPPVREEGVVFQGKTLSQDPFRKVLDGDYD